MVRAGQVGPLRIDLDAIEERLARPDYAPVAKSLREIGIGSAVEFFAKYAGRPGDLTMWLQGAAINRDRDLRLQYLAGMGMNVFQSDRIYPDLPAYRRFPGNPFFGSKGRLQALREHGRGG